MGSKNPTDTPPAADTSSDDGPRKRVDSASDAGGETEIETIAVPLGCTDAADAGEVHSASGAAAALL